MGCQANLWSTTRHDKDFKRKEITGGGSSIDDVPTYKQCKQRLLSGVRLQFNIALFFTIFKLLQTHQGIV